MFRNMQAAARTISSSNLAFYWLIKVCMLASWTLDGSWARQERNAVKRIPETCAASNNRTRLFSEVEGNPGLKGL